MTRLMPVGLLVACTTPLEEGFEASLTRGWACGEDFVVLTDGAETVKLVASFADSGGEPLPEDERLMVYTGSRLVPYQRQMCDWPIQPMLGDQPRIDCRYDQASGVVSAEVDGDEIAVITEGVTLTPSSDYHAACEEQADVVMSDGALTAMPLPGIVAL